MAVNIFDKYGIKEVANVYFEALEDDLSAGVYKGDIVLFLDTLKVSTIETTAENVAAQGGWGNPRLISWDYGKEINITLEDALMSLESLRFMLGGAVKKASTENEVWVSMTAQVVAKEGGKLPLPKERFSGEELTPTAYPGRPIKLINLTKGTRTQITVDTGSKQLSEDAVVTFKNPKMINPDDKTSPHTEAVDKGDIIRIFWEEKATGEKVDATEVTISPDTFPGTYRIVGDTFMRSEKTGKDEAFQFIIGKAKVLSEVTITLEAEGDPSTFEMQLQVLRSTDANEGDNEMMKLVRYNVTAGTGNSAEDDYGSVQAGSAVTSD